ncbi:hypothetical protein [Paraburkholderia terrae]|nr:hypothetical protein [Paraburkholderia terrae]
MPPFARLTFAGLLTLADREGRLEDRPGRIKADLFAYDANLGDPEVDQFLALLDEADLIVRYEVDGEQIIQITKWKKHQRPHPREVQSVLPSPPANPRQTRKPNLRQTQGKPKANHLMKLKPGSSGSSGPSESKPKTNLSITSRQSISRARDSDAPMTGQDGTSAGLRDVLERQGCELTPKERDSLDAAAAEGVSADSLGHALDDARQRPSVRHVVAYAIRTARSWKATNAEPPQPEGQRANGHPSDFDSLAKDRKRISDGLTGRTRRQQQAVDANVIDVPMPEVRDESRHS